MKDKLVKAVACEGRIRILACTTTNLCEVARTDHDMWPTSAAALGRVLSMGCMLGSMLKTDEEKVTIQINGNGPIGTIMVDAYANGTVRGFVGDPHIHMTYNDTGKLAVGTAVGTDGFLKVIKDLNMKNDFTGQVALQSGEIGDDFAYYFTVSEQTPSAVSVGVLVDTDNSIKSAGGILIQMMPDATEEDIELAEKAVSNLRPVSSLVMEGKEAKDLACDLFENVQILEERELCFKCDCSKDRFMGALSTLDLQDLKEMKEEDHGCEITCQFCSKQYHFTEDELQSIMEFKQSCGK